MRIYDEFDDEGRLVSFEINNIPLGRLWVIWIVGSIPGVRNVWSPSLTWSSPDMFCSFELDGVAFEVEEFWGDSSRLSIAPKPVRFVPQTETVRAVFVNAKKLQLLRSYIRGLL